MNDKVINKLDHDLSTVYSQLPQPVATDLHRIVYEAVNALKPTSIKIIDHEQLTDVPWDELDDGIVQVVRALNDAGVATTGSCDGHGRQKASLTLPYGNVFRVATVLHEAGYRGFTINERYEFLNVDKALRFLTVEFWCDGPPSQEPIP